MSVAADIVASWLRPRPVLRRHLAAGRREDRALIFLMLGCGLIAIGQLPRLQREAALGGGVPVDMGMGGVILAWLFLVPVAAYAIAAISHLAARALGGSGDWFGARMALFWAMLAAAPLWLTGSLIDGYLGAAAVPARVAGLIALVAFLFIWLAGLIEAETGRGE